MKNKLSLSVLALIALVTLLLTAMSACSCSGDAQEFSLDMTVSDSDSGTSATTYKTNPSDDGFGTPVPM